MTYALHIYLPGNSGYDVGATLESEEPFLPIQRGDVINPRTFNSHYASHARGDVDPEQFPHGIVLRVTGFEHFIVQNEENEITRHGIGIFTEAIHDVAETRP